MFFDIKYNNNNKKIYISSGGLRPPTKCIGIYFLTETIQSYTFKFIVFTQTNVRSIGYNAIRMVFDIGVLSDLKKLSINTKYPVIGFGVT